MTATDFSSETGPSSAAVDMWIAEQDPRNPDILHELALRAVRAVREDAKSGDTLQGDQQLAYAYAVGERTRAEVREADDTGSVNDFSVLQIVNGIVHEERDRRQAIRRNHGQWFAYWRISRYHDQVGYPAEFGLVISAWEQRSAWPFETDSYRTTAGITATMATLSQLSQERLILSGEDAAPYLK